jgi:hypothetical protein
VELDIARAAAPALVLLFGRARPTIPLGPKAAATRSDSGPGGRIWLEQPGGRSWFEPAQEPRGDGPEELAGERWPFSRAVNIYFQEPSPKASAIALTSVSRSLRGSRLIMG